MKRTKLASSQAEFRRQPFIAGTRFDQRREIEAMGKPGQDITTRWFNMKYFDDVSGLRPENGGYYKHYVHHFVSRWFTREKCEGRKILDFGCGPGFYSVLLAQRGALVTGIDLSPFLIDKAKQYAARLGVKPTQFLQGDFLRYAAEAPARQFDFIVAIDTIVSFNYERRDHNHAGVSKAFSGIQRLLKDDGTFLVIESHPFFGQVFTEVPTEGGEWVCLRSSNYKIEYRLKTDVHHWPTLAEMTNATSENGLAIFRIHEPDPSPELERESPAGYRYRLKYPAMIVYEIRKLTP